MAEKRMFAKTIIDSDAFIDMPLSAQALYFHLAMRADDDGFLNNAQKVMRMVGAAKNDYDLLIAKRFVIVFPDGICVIKHWRIHNYLRKDRYIETVYTEHKAMLAVKENGSYSENIQSMEPVGIPDDNQRLTQIRVDKSREEEKSLEAQQRHKFGQYGWVLLTDEQHERLYTDLGTDEAERVIRLVDESAQASGNRNGWKDWNLVCRKASRDKWGLQKFNSNEPPDNYYERLN
jgi:hypothetical protein